VVYVGVYYLFFLEKKYIFIEHPERSVEDSWQSLRMILKIGIPTAIMALMDVIAFCSVAILILPLGVWYLQPIKLSRALAVSCLFFLHQLPRLIAFWCQELWAAAT
jgi:MATE family multidrug resistance protein